MRRQLLAALILLTLTACAAQKPPQEDPAPQPAPVETAEPENAAPPEPNAGTYQVTVDWTRLEREPELPEVGSDWYDPLPEDLIPAEGYGELVPYAGQRLYDDWPATSGCLYGLMTRDGVAVTAATYSSITRAGLYVLPETLPVMLLRRGEAGEDEYSVDPVYAVAASDGSWCTEFLYRGISVDGDCLMLYDEAWVTRMSPAGEIQDRWTVEELGFSREQYDMWLSYNAGWVCNCHDSILCVAMDENGENLSCVDLKTGERLTMALETFLSLDDSVWPVIPEPAVEGAERLLDEWLGEAAPGLLRHTEYGGEAVASHTVTYYREDGTPLPQLTQFAPGWYDRVSVVGGCIEVLELQTASYYDLETMACLFRTGLHYAPE